MSHPSSKLRGFTLVEILCAVVIIGICAAAVIPRVNNRDDLRVSSMSRAMMANIIYSQNRAITLQKVQYVRFDTASQRYDLLDAINPDTFVTHPVDGGQFRVLLGSGRTDDLKSVSIAAVSFDSQAVLAFDELGTPYAYNTTTQARTALTAGSITLQAGSKQMVISVEPFTGALQAN